MKLNDLALGLVMVAFGAAIIQHARGFPEMAGMQYGPAFFPVLIGAGFAICGLALLGSGALAMIRGGAGPLVQLPDWTNEPVNLFRAAGVIVAVAFYVFAVGYLGFILTMFVVTLFLLLILGNRILVAVPIAVILPLILYYAFQVALRVPLPRGPVEMMFF